MMGEYRECVRGIWNNTFRPSVGKDADFDDVDAFWIVRDTLLAEFVLRRLGLPFHNRDRGDRYSREPVNRIRVVPRPNPVPVKVNRPSADGNLYWDDPVRSVRAEGLALQWIDFFDWNNFGFIDLQYHLVRIDECSEHPHLVGKAALIEVLLTDVHVIDVD